MIIIHIQGWEGFDFSGRENPCSRRNGMSILIDKYEPLATDVEGHGMPWESEKTFSF
jgi:hypothetical protein